MSARSPRQVDPNAPLEWPGNLASAPQSGDRINFLEEETRSPIRPAVEKDETSPVNLLPDPISKVALVTHDYNVQNELGFWDYSEHFHPINRLCDNEGCDTILYALYTWDHRSPVARTHDSIFGSLRKVRRVILEVGEPTDWMEHVEVWERGQPYARIVVQRFATSVAPAAQKQQFLDELPGRRVADGLLVLCGETNIGSLVRGSDEFYDPYHFVEQLQDMKVRVVLNPVHDYMRRYEMREKRRHYSSGGRTVVSVWNQGKGRESHFPWTVFLDGVERTGDVVDLPSPVSERPDIRIGVLDLTT